MNKVEAVFSNVQAFASSVYVADYTNQTQSARGVEIQEVPFTDISYFCLHNDVSIPLWAVNFEHNKGFFPAGVGDCECMFRVKGVEKGWLLLCELKYCMEKNIASNADEAYGQLKATWQLLVDKKVFNKRLCKSFFNISVPDHSERTPFTSFVTTQNDKIEWLKKNKIHLLGHNDILVINEGILQVSKVEV